MPMYQKFEDLPVWQEAARLYQQALDLLAESGVALSPGFRHQLDRAALSVSNNIAAGFEQATTRETAEFLALARSSGGEVRSMIAVVQDLPKLKPHRERLQAIRALADSCARQLVLWIRSLDASSGQGKQVPAADRGENHSTPEPPAGNRPNASRPLPPKPPMHDSTKARPAR